MNRMYTAGPDGYCAQQGEELMTLAEELRRDALLNVAKAMLQRGFDLQLIMEMTGLSQEDLYQLQS